MKKLHPNASGKIFSVRLSRPGSEHDSPIFESSDLFRLLRDQGLRQFPKAIILSDSTYKGTHHFMCTPFLDATAMGDSRKERFNECFRRARTKVDICIGAAALTVSICVDQQPWNHGKSYFWTNLWTPVPDIFCFVVLGIVKALDGVTIELKKAKKEIYNLKKENLKLKKVIFSFWAGFWQAFFYFGCS
jgi:hypothetical protein